VERSFEIDIDRLKEVVFSRDVRVVGLQLPEGLKRRGPEIAGILERECGVRVLISGNPCFGACDVDTRLLGRVDLLFHLGHSGRDTHRIVFVETPARVEVERVLEKALSLLESERIGLFTTVQHVHSLRDARDFLEGRGKKCVIGKGDGRIKYPGQVLGCNYSAIRGLDCEELLYLGGGSFHPVGASLATYKRVVAADPFTLKVEEINPELVVRRRYAQLSRARDAENWGIAVSTKPGQFREELALEIKRKIEKWGRKAFLAHMDLISPDSLLNLGGEAWVSTACPRIALDDSSSFQVPVITPPELDVLIEGKPWKMDEIWG